MSCLAALLLFGSAHLAASQILTQSRHGTPLSEAPLNENSSNVDMHQSNFSELPKLYRFQMLETFGASYSCLNELEFYDSLLNLLPAKYINSTSCYGCATNECGTCEAPYGNPHSQFDSLRETIGNDVAAPHLWSCTAPGGFQNGKGAEYVIVELPQRPARFILRRVHAGDWILKSFALEEYDWKETHWKALTQTTNASFTKDQSIDVMKSGELQSAVPFPEGFQHCGNRYPQVPETITPGTDAMQGLQVNYVPLIDRYLKNYGQGVQIDGHFGTLTTFRPADTREGATGKMRLNGTTTFDASQIHFRFPSMLHIDRPDQSNDGHRAAGEMHILHQSRFQLGYETRLAIITILLTLPIEGSNTTVEEMFFISAGMQSVPNVSKPAAIPYIMDLYAFTKQLSGPIKNMPCTDTLEWYVAGEYAHVTGSVVKAMQQAFGMFGEWGNSGQDQPDRPTVDWGDLDWPYNITGWVPEMIRMTDNAFIKGYATGDWKNIFAEPTPMPTPAPTYQPAFMTLSVTGIASNQMIETAQVFGPFQEMIRQNVAQHMNVSVENCVIDKVTTTGTFTTQVTLSVYPHNHSTNLTNGLVSQALHDKILKDVQQLRGVAAISSGNTTVDGPTASAWVAPWARPDATGEVTQKSGQGGAVTLAGRSSEEGGLVIGGAFPEAGDVSVVQSAPPDLMF
jgi:carbonic anhydrase